MSTLLIPTVIEKVQNGERAYDIYSRLLKDRLIFLGGLLEDSVANSTIAQLLYLSHDDSTKDINIYINSPGGSVTATMAILDTMNHIKPDVATVCVGMAASGAAIILSAGARGKRSALQNSEIMIHQPHGGAEGQTTDIEIIAKRMSYMKGKLNKILAKNTRKNTSEIAKDVERDFFMDAIEAKKYGIIDNIFK